LVIGGKDIAYGSSSSQELLQYKPMVPFELQCMIALVHQNHAWAIKAVAVITITMVMTMTRMTIMGQSSYDRKSSSQESS